MNFPSDHPSIGKLLLAQRNDLMLLFEQSRTIEALALELGISSIDLRNRLYSPSVVDTLPNAIVCARIARRLHFEPSPYLVNLSVRAGYKKLDDLLLA